MKIKIADITEGKMTQEQAETLQNYFKKGGTWQELLQLKPEEVEQVYAAGYRYYTDREFDKAMASFSTLIQLSPYEAKHWIAIGAVLQAQEHFTDAIGAYEIALTMEEDNVPALFYCAQCSYALDKKEEAKEFLQKLLLASEKTGKDTELAANAKQIIEMIESERA